LVRFRWLRRWFRIAGHPDAFYALNSAGCAFSVTGTLLVTAAGPFCCWR
jgi:hypothetical protein